MKKIEGIDSLIEEVKKYANDSTKLNYQEKDDSIIITVDMSGTDIYQPFSSKALLKEEIFEFIDDTFKLVENKLKPLIIHVVFNENVDQVEKDDIVELIKFHYALECKETRKALIRETRLAIVMLIAGLVLLSAYILLGKLIDNYVLAEIFEVFAWVFLWEAADGFLFRRNRERLELIKNMRIFNAKFE